MSLFQELKRRNVFRVGIAYAVAGWLVLQLTDVLSELLDLPASVGPVVVALVALGLPLALVLAWAFELTPEGVKRESEVDRAESITRSTGRTLDRVIIVLLGVVAAYFIWEARFAPDADREQVAAVEGTLADEATLAEADEPPSGVSIDPRSIAVLPFDNRSRVEDDEFFVEGIHDDLLTTLARIGGLKVISRTSMARYADTQQSVPEIAAELGVATVMEGAVQRSGDMVRINVQLIDAQTDEHLWAQIFDRTLTADNLFAIQTEISEQIAAALQTELTQDETARLVDRPTENLEAYTAYLRGRQLLVNRQSDELAQALEEFRKATALDPDFALAWVGIADAASLGMQYGSLDFGEHIAIRQEAVDRALSLEPELGEAHLAQGSLLGILGQDASAAFERALALSPGNATVYQWYGTYLSDSPAGLPRSVELLQRAKELDPLSLIIRSGLVYALTRQGRYAEAQREQDRLYELGPEFIRTLAGQARLHAEQGRLDDRILWLRKAIDIDPNNIGLYFDLLWAYLDLDDLEAINRLREQMLTRVPEDHYMISWVDLVAAMGEDRPDASLELLPGIRERMGPLPIIESIEGYLHSQRNDPVAARAAFVRFRPELFDPDRWAEAIPEAPFDACVAGWMLQNTGEGERAQALLRDTIRFLEDDLPNYVRNPRTWGGEVCYLQVGAMDKALQNIAARLDQGFLEGWHFYKRYAYFSPLLQEPRFQAMDRQRDEIIARQRQAIRDLELAGVDP